MKLFNYVFWLVLLLFCVGGCTRIVSVEPKSGPPGTPVWIKCSGMWGDPCAHAVKWDGKTISDPFPGSFTVPELCRPGKHTITLVDKIDTTELSMVVPIFRMRHDWATFEVTE